MLRRLLRSAVLIGMVGCLWAPPAQASCVSAVVVDGRTLFGTTVRRPESLPPPDGEQEVISPACMDGEDEPYRVQRLKGVPPRIAVAERSRDSLYEAPGTLTSLAGHPLHRTIYGRKPPSFRAGRRCRAHRTPLAAAALEVATDRGFYADVGDRRAYISVDSATRIVNRPAYTPILPRQRLRLRTSRCGPRRVADRIAFAGPPPPEERYTRSAFPGDFMNERDERRAPYLVPLVICGAVALLLAAVGVALIGPRRPRGRPRRPR